MDTPNERPKVELPDISFMFNDAAQIARPGPTSEPPKPAETPEQENPGTTPEEPPPSTR